MFDVGTRIGSWVGGLLFVGALIGGIWLHGYTKGASKTERVWQERLVVAERAARQTETDLAAIAAQSAKRLAVKEAALHEQAQRQADEWRALLAGLPRCRVPRDVGVRLDVAAGLPNPAAVAGTSEPAADGSALDALVDVADALDACRENAAIGRRNIAALIEARDWYTGLRERVNSGEKP